MRTRPGGEGQRGRARSTGHRRQLRPARSLTRFCSRCPHGGFPTALQALLLADKQRVGGTVVQSSVRRSPGIIPLEEWVRRGRTAPAPPPGPDGLRSL